MSAGIDTVLLIAVDDARDACKGIAGIEPRLRAAMTKAKDFWMGGTDDFLLRAAIGAAALESPPDERDKILATAKVMGDLAAALNAAARGIPVDLLAIVPPEDTVPIGKLWNEIRGPK